MMNSSATAPPKEQKLTKKQRGRLKKLRKRAQEVKEGCETSGLTSASDWIEFQELCASLLVVGPCVRSRRPKQYQQGELQRTEGVDHRDILWNFRQHLSGNNRKRKSDDHAFVLPPIPSWCTLHNPATLESLAVVELQLNSPVTSWNEILEHVPVLSSLLEGHEGKVALPAQTRWFQGPAPKSLSEILMLMPRFKSGKGTKLSQVSSREESESSEDLFKHVAGLLQDLTLSEEIMKKEGYPIAICVNPNGLSVGNDVAGQSIGAYLSLPLDEAKQTMEHYHVTTEHDNGLQFVATAYSEQLEKTPRVFALDCEMVETSQGLELARVTLLKLTTVGKVEEPVSFEVVLDEMVKPYHDIKDYLTEYSGVTAVIMAPVTTRIEQVQAALLSVINNNDVIVGHSLENDLCALGLVHPNVVDTALMFRASSGRKYSLRHLSKTLLGRSIQSSHDQKGHCSQEDAAAALDLAVRRARVGRAFRIEERGDEKFHILEQVSEGHVVCVGESDWLQSHVLPFQNAAHALTCESVVDSNRKAIAAWLSSSTRRAKFLWANLICTPKGDDKVAMSQFNMCLSDVIGRMLPGTALLVCIQSGLAKTVEAAKKRKTCMDPRSSLGWTLRQEADYTGLVEQCSSGYTFWIGDS